MSTISVGIDFGTSNSGVAVYDGRQVQLLPIDQKNVTPEVVKSILYITKEGQVSIGQEAIETYYRQNINRQRRFVKKWVGEIEVRGADMYFVRDVYLLVDELKPGRLLQYIKTGLRSDGYEGTRIFERYYTLQEVIATYLTALKERAEALLGEQIQHVTLGRPVKFFEDPDKDQRAEQTLRQAAVQAGFPQVAFEFEPAAAAYDYETRLQVPETALIFDFGGGTLDITIMRLGEPGNRTVLANGGIGIAGSDFDRAIIQKRLQTFFGKGAISGDPEIQALIEAVADWQVLPELSTPAVRHRLEQAIQAGRAPVRMKALQALIFNDLAFLFYNRVEAAKINLSEEGATVIQMDEQGVSLWELYTRSQFERDIQPEAEQIEAVLLETLAQAGLKASQIDTVVKTGGSSNVPLFGDMLQRIFGAEKMAATNPFTSVTAGLAIRAWETSR